MSNGEKTSPPTCTCRFSPPSAPEDQPLAVKSDENSGVQWIPISEIESYSSDL